MKHWDEEECKVIFFHMEVGRYHAISLYLPGCGYLACVYTQKDTIQLPDWPLEDMVVIRNVNSSTKKWLLSWAFPVKLSSSGRHTSANDDKSMLVQAMISMMLDMKPVHDDVIKWKHFPRYWPFVLGIHRSPMNSPHKGQWRGALMFSLICFWINGWVNNREAGDLRRYRAQYDVTVMAWNNADQKSIVTRPQCVSDMLISY